MHPEQELPVEAVRRSPQGQLTDASDRQPNGDAGHLPCAEEATPPLPASPLPVKAKSSLPQGHGYRASDRQPNGDVGQVRYAEEAKRRVPASPQELPVEATTRLPQGLHRDASVDRQPNGDAGQDRYAEEAKRRVPASPHELPVEATKTPPPSHRPYASDRQPASDDVGHLSGAAGHGEHAPSSLPNDDSEGQIVDATGPATLAPLSSPNEDAAARQHLPNGQRARAVASSPNGDGGRVPIADDGQTKHAPSPTVYDLIRSHHRQREYAIDVRKSVDNKLGALLRMALGWSLDKPSAERARIKEQATALIEAGEREAKSKPAATDDPAYQEWRTIISASIAARAPFDAIEKQMKKEMVRLVESLPIWESFGKPIKGLGAKSLAVIIGEAGDLAAYPKHWHLWKRMGLSVIDGVRQGGLRKTAPKEAWIEHGYNRKRRSKMWVIGDVLRRKQNRYREIYLARKIYERLRAEAAGLTIAPAAKIPKKRATEFMSLGHIDSRAQRYMEQRLLRHLYNAWERDGQIKRAFDGQSAIADPLSPDQ